MGKSIISDTAITVALIVAILAGAACKLLFSLSLDLDSDTVYSGLVSMEFWKHGNYALQGFFFNAMDPHLFSEIFVFQLIPQVLTNYDPTALRLMSFIIFLLDVAVFAYLVYRLTGDKTKALVFAALAASLSPVLYAIYSLPTTHNAAIFFAGVLMVLSLDIKTMGPWKAAFAVLLATAISFSDTIILAFFVVPYVIVYALLVKPKTARTNIIAGSLLAFPVLATAYKMLLMDNAMPYVVDAAGNGNTFLGNLGAFVDSFPAALNYNLYSISSGPGALGLVDYVVAILIGAVLVFQVVKDKNEKLREFYLFFVVSTGIVLAGCLFTSLSAASPRYLTFAALLALMIVAFAYSKGNKAYLAILAIVLVACLGLNFVEASRLDYRPNADQYALIGFLESNNLTYGYGDYWDANVYTYLSGEKVTILPVDFYNSSIVPYQWLVSERWYEKKPADYFVIVRKGSYKDMFMQTYVEGHPAKEKLEYKGYWIYTFEDASIYEKWHFEFMNGLSRGLRALKGKGVSLPF